MKFAKFIIAACAAAFLSTEADAQLYLSGSFNLNHESGKTEAGSVTVDKNPVNTFTIAPEIGYYFNDNMAFGAELGFTMTKTKSANNKDNWTADNMFHFNPFFRWDFVDNDKFAFGLKAMALIEFGKEKTNSDDIAKLSEFGGLIIPVMDYKVNEHWAATVSFGSLGYTSYASKDPDNSDVKTTTNDLGINLNLSTLTFGVVYTF